MTEEQVRAAISRMRAIAAEAQKKNEDEPFPPEAVEFMELMIALIEGIAVNVAKVREYVDHRG